MPKKLLIISAFAAFIGAIVVINYYQRRQSETAEVINEVGKNRSDQGFDEDIEVLAQNLSIPWEAAFLPDGSILLTERPGRVRMISREGNLLPSPVATISKVIHIGEGGLLGITVHPDFESNRYVYLYYTYSSTGNKTLNRVSRFKFENAKFTDEKVVVDAIPGAVNHNGGRIKFGPDGFLYVTTGDAQNPSLAQDKNSLAGKILRVTDEGKAASGKPFDNLIYSYGHRNPQGLAWDNQGRLWAVEHGPQALDELNLIDPSAGEGANYGWPVIQGDGRQGGMVNPIIQSGPSTTWAPSGAAFYDGRIFFGGLRGESLFEYNIEGKSLKRYFQGEFGRIRAVVLGPDGYLYITTSNTDGRGNPKEGDDKLIKANPKIFE